MPIFYIESSALVKRYVPERGAEVLDELFDNRLEDDFLMISILAGLELKSAFTRLVKGGQITQADLNRMLSAFRQDRQRLSSLLPFDNAIIEEATGHLDRHPLKTLDAVHLASIFRVRETARRTGEPLAVLASDGELVSACRSEGITTVNPEEANSLDKMKRLRQ